MSTIVRLAPGTPYLERYSAFIELRTRAKQLADKDGSDVRVIGGNRMVVSDAVAKALGGDVESVGPINPTSTPAPAAKAAKKRSTKKAPAKKAARAAKR